MIILKIPEPGHTIDLPGIQTVRSPVEIDITKLDARLVMMHLAKAGIKKYEIKSGDISIKQEVKTKVVKSEKTKIKEEKSDEIDRRIDTIINNGR